MRSVDSQKLAVAQPLEQWAVIRVGDTGPGLPRELGQRIFEPFVTTKPTGTGLGLSICRQIVTSHGGTISANDCGGAGAAFEVRLPLSNRNRGEVSSRRTALMASVP